MQVLLNEEFELTEDTEIEIQGKAAGIFYNNAKLNVFDVTNNQEVDFECPTYSMNLEALDITLRIRIGSNWIDLPTFSLYSRFTLPRGKYKFAYQTWGTNTGNWYVTWFLYDIAILKK